MINVAVSTRVIYSMMFINCTINVKETLFTSLCNFNIRKCKVNVLHVGVSARVISISSNVSTELRYSMNNNRGVLAALGREMNNHRGVIAGLGRGTMLADRMVRDLQRQMPAVEFLGRGRLRRIRAPRNAVGSLQREVAADNDDEYLKNYMPCTCINCEPPLEHNNIFF